ncbi:hypothetical protein BJV74DRAFT_884899 [Russula compacta]|nr:hypothetical protein BJV74DRAFT_884899 [Russula compacta]
MSKKCTATKVEISKGDAEPENPVKKCGCPAGSKNKPKPALTPKGVKKPPVAKTATQARAKHTSEQVKADDAYKAQLQKELEELNKQNIETLAEMDAEEEFEDAEEELLRTTGNSVPDPTSMDWVDDADVKCSGKEQENLNSDVVEGSEESKVLAKNGAQKGLAATGTHKQPSTSASSFEYGGLADDDAFAVAPPVDLSGKNCNSKHVNNFVELSSAKEEEPVYKKTCTKPSTKSGTKLVTAHTTGHGHSGSSKKMVEVKHEPSILSSSNNEVTILATSINLPAFTQASWKMYVIPKLHCCLAIALNPWNIEDGVNILVVIQWILDNVYPGSGYKVKYGNKIYSMAKDHLNDQ